MRDRMVPMPPVASGGASAGGEAFPPCAGSADRRTTREKPPAVRRVRVGAQITIFEWLDALDARGDAP